MQPVDRDKNVLNAISGEIGDIKFMRVIGSETKRRRLLKYARYASFSPHQVLQLQGEPLHGIYLVLEGDFIELEAKLFINWHSYPNKMSDEEKISTYLQIKTQEGEDHFNSLQYKTSNRRRVEYLIQRMIKIDPDSSVAHAHFTKYRRFEKGDEYGQFELIREKPLRNTIVAGPIGCSLLFIPALEFNLTMGSYYKHLLTNLKYFFERKIFKGVKEHDVFERMLLDFKYFEVSNGEYIYKQNDVADYAYILLKGEVRQEINALIPTLNAYERIEDNGLQVGAFKHIPLITCIFCQNEILGEIEVFSKKSILRRESLRVTGQTCLLYRMQIHKLKAYASDSPAIRKFLLARIQVRLSQIQKNTLKVMEKYKEGDQLRLRGMSEKYLRNDSSGRLNRKCTRNSSRIKSLLTRAGPRLPHPSLSEIEANIKAVRFTVTDRLKSERDERLKSFMRSIKERESQEGLSPVRVSTRRKPSSSPKRTVSAKRFTSSSQSRMMTVPLTSFFESDKKTQRRRQISLISRIKIN